MRKSQRTSNAGGGSSELRVAPDSGSAPAIAGAESEARFRALFASLREGLAYCRMIFDAGRAVDWTYLEVNPGFYELTGLRDVVGRRVSEVIPALARENPEVIETYGRVVLTGVSERFEAFIHPLGIWLAISVIRPEEGCFVALFENITPQVRAKEELEASTKLVQATLDGLSSHIAVVGPDGEIVAVNRAWTEFAEANGGSGDARVLVGANYLAACDRAAQHGSSSAANFAAGLRSVLAKESDTFEFEYGCHAPDCERWFVARVTRADDSSGRAIVAHENVTERVRSNRRTEESLSRLTSMMESSPDAMFVNRDDRIVHANPQTLRLFGAEVASDVIGRSPLDFIHPQGTAMARERIARTLQSGEPAPLMRQRIVRLDGRIVDVEVAASRFLEAGEPAIFVTMRDITERLSAEAWSRHQEAMLREAGEIALVGGWEFDPATGEGSWTEEVAKIHEFDPSDRTSKAIGLDYYQGESRTRIEAALAAAIEHGTPYDLELELTTPSGVRKQVRTICHPEVREGKVVRVRGSIQDVTARVSAERALVAERSRLRAVLATIPDKIWLKDPDGVYLGCNPAFERMIGVREADLVGHTDFDFFPSEVAEAFRYHDRAALAAGKPTINEEWVDSADGSRERLETIKTPVKGPNGEVLGALGIARDVTLARATAESLRQSEERLRLFIEHAPVALAMFDREMRYLAASRRWQLDYGLGEGPLEGRSHYEIFPEIGEEWKAVHRRSLAGEVVRSEEEAFVRADGTRQWIKWETYPWRDSSGGVAGVVIFTEDVTAQHLALERLAESEAHFRALDETTFDWIWEVDEEDRYTFVSPRVAELLGYAPEEVLGRTPFDFMPPAESARVRAIFSGIAAKRIPFANLENQNLHRDGRIVVLESSGVPFFGAGGALRGYRGMDRDITARKQAERRSRTQSAVSRVLAETSSLREAAPGVLEAIGVSEAWLCGSIWVFDEEGETLSSVETWHRDGFGGEAFGAATRSLKLRRGEGFPGHVSEVGQPIVWNRISDETKFLRQEAAREAGLQAAIGFPIRSGDAVLGVVEFFGEVIATPEPQLVETCDAIGRQLGQFVERRRSEATVGRFIAGSPAVIYALRVTSSGLRLAWFSENLEKMTGWSSVHIDDYAWWLENIHPDDRERVVRENNVPYAEEHKVVEFRFRHRDGHYLWVRDEKRLLHDASGKATEVVGSWIDITSRVELEEKLRVSQKLEAIGRLAGGVAHDFNNMLTVIGGNGEMLARKLPPESGELALLGEIREATDRAAGLTRQLLAFSRTQMLAPQVTGLATIVGRVETMLRRLIGEDIRLVCSLAPDTGFVLVDPSQLEQVILNLAVNARDAMPKGGTLTISTSARAVEAGFDASGLALPPGKYARLSVADTGCGMTPEVREKIFEPFFTTKPPGSGTGLGLATVFGIVRQSGGQIEVASEPGSGTRFDIDLPQVSAPPAESGPKGVATVSARGHETILLVEDEAGVRRVARMALERQGYVVYAAASGREALDLAKQHGDEIDLLLTDLVMPELSGRELAETLTARYPKLAVLLMSGYVEDDFVRLGVQADELNLLHKPFTLAQLAAKVREVLDGGGAAPEGPPS